MSDPKVSITEADLPGDQRGPDELMKLGWAYCEISWCTEATWQELLGIIGVENFKLLAMTIRRRDGGRRGQLFVSPAGMTNLRAHRRAGG